MVLAAPLLAGMPEGLRLGPGLLLAVGGTALLGLAGGGRGRAAAGGALLACGLGLLLAVPLAGVPAEARRVLAAAVLMAVWWMTVALPIPATSLLPIVLFPFLGVMPAGDVAANYANSTIFLFLGGFILALGLERWGVHRRIALNLVRLLGTNPARMVLGFMAASAFLSMWISNTATTLMMLPIALAVITSNEERGSGSGRGFAPALLLGTAYGASIGGLATPIGTPPNLSFLRILKIQFPDAPEIPFGTWLLALLPLVLVFIPLAWLVLTRLVHPVGAGGPAETRSVVRERLRALGRPGPAERRMLAVFLVTAVLWVTRRDLELGGLRLPGWSGLLEDLLGPPFEARLLHDATVALTMALLTFLIPSGEEQGGALMDWETARRLPWGILLLFGGGFALAAAFSRSGLSRHLGEAFAGALAGTPPVLLVLAACLLLTFLTELTSNTATTEVMLPVLAGTATAMGSHPMLLMIPATLSASCAFMLPIATPPNAIVFGSGRLDMGDMIRAGILLNLMGALLITTMFFAVIAPLLGFDPSRLPAWAGG